MLLVSFPRKWICCCFSSPKTKFRFPYWTWLPSLNNTNQAQLRPIRHPSRHSGFLNGHWAFSSWWFLRRLVHEKRRLIVHPDILLFSWLHPRVLRLTLFVFTGFEWARVAMIPAVKQKHRDEHECHGCYDYQYNDPRGDSLRSWCRLMYFRGFRRLGLWRFWRNTWQSRRWRRRSCLGTLQYEQNTISLTNKTGKPVLFI